uniref:Uncharacterized protein n=1 Tax=Cacopsylla melanoneura TaxID=428564 RepID=A0A8D8TR45_9HEMI
MNHHLNLLRRNQQKLYPCPTLLHLQNYPVSSCLPPQVLRHLLSLPPLLVSRNFIPQPSRQQSQWTRHPLRSFPISPNPSRPTKSYRLLKRKPVQGVCLAG